MAGFTPQQLAALEASIALGVLSMEHQGKKTTFQSLSAMLDLRDRMKSEIQAANAAPGAPIPCMTRPTYYRRG